jgi:hypothetical protein
MQRTSVIWAPQCAVLYHPGRFRLDTVRCEADGVMEYGTLRDSTPRAALEGLCKILDLPFCLLSLRAALEGVCH